MCGLLENLPRINQRRDKTPPLICMFFCLLSLLRSADFIGSTRVTVGHGQRRSVSKRARRHPIPPNWNCIHWKTWCMPPAASLSKKYLSGYGTGVTPNSMVGIPFWNALTQWVGSWRINGQRCGFTVSSSCLRLQSGKLAKRRVFPLLHLFPIPKKTEQAEKHTNQRRGFITRIDTFYHHPLSFSWFYAILQKNIKWGNWLR